MKIGNVELENNLILAPMAGVTDLPFRRVCEEIDPKPGLVCTEMISSKGLIYNEQKSQRILDTTGEKPPISFQIFGSDVEAMTYAAKYLNDNCPIDILDINMGCPVPKVVKNGDGSRLLLDLDKAEEIIKAVVQSSRVPVTVKIRTGWDKEHIVADDLAKRAELAGVSAITVHGRTRSEFYTGQANLDIIKKVKETVKTIPVIGNGDVVDEDSARHMMEYTGVDGLMIGRGVLGNPWIFKRINHYLKTGEHLPPVSNIEKLETMKKHIKLAVELKGENAIKELRKHIAWYTKNLKNSSEFRSSINKIEDKDELIKMLDDYFLTLTK